MSDIRHIELPEKDRPLRADVSLLGSLVGEVLVDQHGPELLQRVEAVRKAAIRQREGLAADGEHSQEPEHKTGEESGSLEERQRDAVRDRPCRSGSPEETLGLHTERMVPGGLSGHRHLAGQAPGRPGPSV